MSTTKLIELADLLANDLLTFAGDQGLSAHDLLMVTALSERLLQTAVCPGDDGSAIRAMQEAEATFIAVANHLEPN